MLNTLCEGLDRPSTLVVPLEHRDPFGPAPARLAKVAGGGVVCVAHLSAAGQTLEAVKAAGITRLMVHVRDSRAATLFWCHNLVDAPYALLPKRATMRAGSERLSHQTGDVILPFLSHAASKMSLAVR